VCHLSKVLPKVRDTIGVIVFNELLVAFVYLGLSCFGRKFEEGVGIGWLGCMFVARGIGPLALPGTVGSVLRSGSFPPVLQDPPQREAEDYQVIKATKGPKDIGDKIERKYKIHECEDESRVGRCKKFHRGRILAIR
jgi:hypothetical protein